MISLPEEIFHERVLLHDPAQFLQRARFGLRSRKIQFLIQPNGLRNSLFHEILK